MRSTIDTLLQELDGALIEMGEMCEQALTDACIAMREGDIDIAERVMKKDDLIDDLESKIDEICLTILLREQPFARDLRRVIAATKMVTDLERIGDQAADIADIVIIAKRQGKLELPNVDEMARKACKMVSDCVHAFVRGDIELTRTIIKADDEVDELFEKVKDKLSDLLGKDDSIQDRAIDIIMITKYLERIADHATNVAEWVEFSITGVHPSYNG
ncbi:MAG: phosphate signaling complex protein PhoU [Eubacteriales bacterium]